MSATPRPRSSARSDGAARRLQRWRILRVVLGLVVLGSCAATVLTGWRDARWPELQDGLSQGTITRVDATGGFTDASLAQGVTGTTTLRACWQGRLVRHCAEVRQSSGKDIPADVQGSFTQAVHDIRPQAVVQHDGSHSSDTTTSIGHWSSEGPWGLVVLTAWLVLVVMLVTGPQPSLATRWAWFWLWTPALMLITFPLYLVKGAEPWDGQSRRIGGWTAVLLCFLGSALGVSL